MRTDGTDSAAVSRQAQNIQILLELRRARENEVKRGDAKRSGTGWTIPQALRWWRPIP